MSFFRDIALPTAALGIPVTPLRSNLRVKDSTTGRFTKKARYSCPECGTDRTAESCRNCYAKKQREDDPAAYKEYQRVHILRRHGIEAIDYAWLTTIYQQDRCALCDKSLSEFPKSERHIDHAHNCPNTNRYGQEFGCPLCIRGVLCGTCNRYRIPGIEFISEKGLFHHPYLSRRPILEFKRTNQ